MLNLSAYLKNIEAELKTARTGQGSTVEKAINDLVNRWIKENKPTTISAIAKELKKSTQQIHQTLSRATLVKKYKHNGRVLVIPSNSVVEQSKEKAKAQPKVK